MRWLWRKPAGNWMFRGRLIPVPREISAGCGLAWCAPLTERDRLARVMAERGIEQEDLHECMLKRVSATSAHAERRSGV